MGPKSSTEAAKDRAGFPVVVLEAITRVIDSLHFDHEPDLALNLLRRIRREDHDLSGVLDSLTFSTPHYIETHIRSVLRTFLDPNDDWTLLARLRLAAIDWNAPAPADVLWVKHLAGEPISHFGGVNHTPEHIALMHDIAVTRLDQIDIALVHIAGQKP